MSRKKNTLNKKQQDIRRKAFDEFYQIRDEIKRNITELEKMGFEPSQFKLPRRTANYDNDIERATTRLEHLISLVQDLKDREYKSETDGSNDWYYAISKFRMELTQGYTVNFPFVPFLLKWASDIISTFGEYEFGMMLFRGAEQGLILNKEVMYNQNNAGTDYMSSMLELLAPDEPMKRQQLFELMEYYEDDVWATVLRDLDY